MKVEIKELNQKKERDFPKLMVSNGGTIVFFTARGKGVVIKAVGTMVEELTYDEGWVQDKFFDFEGSITLSND